MENDYEPVIIAFCCNWCSYASADSAGTARIQYPSNIHIIRAMCTGMVHPNFVMDALTNGYADGVLICGCHIGDCHYVNGNYKTVRRMPVLTHLLEQYGFNPNRVWLRHISASEGAELTEIVKEYVEVLKKIGPNPVKLQK